MLKNAAAAVAMLALLVSGLAAAVPVAIDSIILGSSDAGGTQQTFAGAGGWLTVPAPIMGIAPADPNAPLVHLPEVGPLASGSHTFYLYGDGASAIEQPYYGIQLKITSPLTIKFLSTYLPVNTSCSNSCTVPSVPFANGNTNTLSADLGDGTIVTLSAFGMTGESISAVDRVQDITHPSIAFAPNGINDYVAMVTLTIGTATAPGGGNVSEPLSALLLAAGLGAMALIRRRRDPAGPA
ncbi:MAG: hypothetical protein ACT4P4_28625 [Betaproteobacteria bacterium]